MLKSSGHAKIRGFSRVLTRTRDRYQKKLTKFSKPPKPDDPSPPPPTYTRNTVHKISGILRICPWDTAKIQIESLPLKWDSHIICKVLKTHPPMEKAWMFFLWASKIPGFKHDQFTYTTMLDIFGEAGRIASMKHLVSEMEAKGVTVDVATFTSVMNWLGKIGDFDGALSTWKEMKKKGIRPTVVSYTVFIKVLFDSGRPKEAARAYREMLKAGVPPSCHTYTVFMENLAENGKFKAALDIMIEMQEAGINPDKATCNALVHKCSKAGETSALVQILHYMKEHGLVLRRPVFLEAVEAFKAKGLSDNLLREVNPHLALEGMENGRYDSEAMASDISSCIDKDLVLNLLARRNFCGMEHLISGMVSKKIELELELLSSVVQASCSNNRTSTAITAFNFYKSMGKKLDRVASTSLLGLFIRMDTFQDVVEVSEEIVKSDVKLGPHLVSLLILKLGCAGMYAAARKIFLSLTSEHNTATYTAIINVSFQARDANGALEFYSDMRRRGIPASKGTFEVLLTALGEMGRVQEAEYYRKEKKRVHFSCDNPKRISMEKLCDRLFDLG